MTEVAHTISAATVKAYHDALYVVYSKDKDICLRAGQSSSELVELMKIHGVNSAAFLTAYNPYSVISRAEENIIYQKSLIADIESLGLASIAGEGVDNLHVWPSEPSILALGIRLDDAQLLADKYQQNAFLWISGEDALVSLNLRYLVQSSN
jgi:hypothetical protein